MASADYVRCKAHLRTAPMSYAHYWCVNRAWHHGYCGRHKEEMRSDLRRQVVAAELDIRSSETLKDSLARHLFADDHDGDSQAWIDAYDRAEKILDDAESGLTPRSAPPDTGGD